MANNVTALQLGGAPQIQSSVSTVQDVVNNLGLTMESVSVKVNGQPAESSTALKDYDFVAFGEKVKGGFLCSTQTLTHWSFV